MEIVDVLFFKHQIKWKCCVLAARRSYEHPKATQNPTLSPTRTVSDSWKALASSDWDCLLVAVLLITHHVHEEHNILMSMLER